MAEKQMRGYVMMAAVAYLRKTAGEQRAMQIIDGLSPETKQALNTAKEASWCSSESIGEVFRAIASLSNGDEAAAQKHLVETGKSAAKEASNHFLKLLMKLLTPTMFSKKLPDLWSRDCTVGKIAVEVFEDRIRNRLVDVAGFDHLGPVAVGYVSFALEAMGKSITKTELHGWSLATPGVDCWFEVFWKT
jgi:hypothetical protein